MQFNGIWHRLMQEDNNRAAQKIKVKETGLKQDPKASG